MMAAIMVTLLSGLWLIDKWIEQGNRIKWPSALSRGSRPRGGPRTDP